MGYYLQWPDSTGSRVTNTGLLQISGVSGTLISIEYVVKTSPKDYTEHRYLFDIRRLAGTTSNGGGANYLFQSSQSGFNNTGTSNFKKNGSAVFNNDLFRNYEADDTFSFDINQTPSGGTFAFGARFTETENYYGLSVSSIIVEDSDGFHIIDMSDSGGSGTSLTSTDGDITATLFNFPTDDSQWVFYAPPAVTPINPSVTNLLATSARLNWEQG